MVMAETRLRVLFVWHDPLEREMLERFVAPNQPSWQLTSIHHSDVAGIEQALSLLRSMDVIVLHLSLPAGVALKLAECVHLGRLETRIVLFSGTPAPRSAVRKLFAAHARTLDGHFRLAAAINEAAARPL